MASSPLLTHLWYFFNELILSDLMCGQKKKKYCLYAGIDFRSINAQTRRIDYVTSLSQNESLKIQFLKMSN